MDIFCEQLVTRTKTAKDILKISGIIAAGIAVTLLLIALLGVLSFALVCGVWFGVWWLVTRVNTEYEYIITSTVLDIDKIMAQRSRKRLLSIDLKNAERFMPIKDIPKIDNKIIDATPNGIEDGVYGVDFMENGQIKRLLFKPNKEMLSSAKKASPSLVVLRQEDVEE